MNNFKKVWSVLLTNFSLQIQDFMQLQIQTAGVCNALFRRGDLRVDLYTSSVTGIAFTSRVKCL